VAVHPSEGFVESLGYKMHFLEWGAVGRCIVALHSMLMNAHDFDIFARSMSGDYRVLAIDLIGHGESSKPTTAVPLEQHVEVIREVVKARGVQRSIVIGHSIGGILGIIYAAKHPEELEKLVLVDIAPRVSSERIVRRRTPPPRPFKSEREARAYFKRRFRRFTEEARESAFKHMLERAPDGTLRFKARRESVGLSTREGTPLDLWPYVERIGIPVLLIKGGDSPTVSLKSVEMLRRTLRDFTFVEVERATHMIPQDAPEEFERIVREFIEQPINGKG